MLNNLYNGILQQLVMQHAYTMFISNDRVSFHLWWKEMLVKQQKVSKYYENNCSICYNAFVTIESFPMTEFPSEVAQEFVFEIVATLDESNECSMEWNKKYYCSSIN